jgi:thioredoxin reductase (NADPH)
MMLGQIDGYLFEPWLPVGRWLHLPISQVLADWSPSHAPQFEGIRIVGPPLGTRSHELRDRLTRMGIPHGWYRRTPRPAANCSRRPARRAPAP